MFIDDDKKPTVDDTTQDDDTTVEDDDTSTDSDDTEEESTDTSTDESNDVESDDESNDGDDEDSGAVGIAKKYFSDPKSIKPELRVDFKKMQGILTRATQESALHRKKAEALDNITILPEFQAWARDYQQGIIKRASSVTSDEDDSSDDNDDAPVTNKTLKSFLKKAIADELAPMKKQDAETQHNKNVTEFKKANPDWQLYTSDLDKLWSKYPSMMNTAEGLQDSYDLVTSKGNRVVARKQNIITKKNANISKPSQHSGKDAAKQGKLTLAESFELAWDTVINKGKNRR